MEGTAHWTNYCAPQMMHVLQTKCESTLSPEVNLNRDSVILLSF